MPADPSAAMVPHVPTDALAVDEPTAARMLGISAKTLGRLARDGERVGKLKIGSRVLYDVTSLKTWLAAQADAQRTAPTT